ncbi:amidase family protein [Azospirillum cavernae]|uniref:amidase family protein n=1 Tax=Azospirillum cavernae TaxID=2320860 RepID=UPI001314267B
MTSSSGGRSGLLGKVNLGRVRHGIGDSSPPTRARRSSPWSHGQPGHGSQDRRGRVPPAARRRRWRAGGAGRDRHRHRGSISSTGGLHRHVGVTADYGACSRWGIVATPSLAGSGRAGWLARWKTRRYARAPCVGSIKDLDWSNWRFPIFGALTGDIRGLRVGIPKEYRVEGLSAEIDALWSQGVQWLKDAGAVPVEISLPHTKYALAAYYIIAPAEASSNLARYDGVRFGLRVEGGSLNELYENTRGAGFGKEVQRRILIGTYVLSAGYYDAYYNKARQVRTRIKWDFDEAFKSCDVILTPTAPSTPFAIGEKMDDPVQMYLNDVFTVPINLAGLPAMSVPAGLGADGLPLGLQLIGRPFDEETLLRVGQVLEKAANVTATPNFMA